MLHPSSKITVNAAPFLTIASSFANAAPVIGSSLAWATEPASCTNVCERLESCNACVRQPTCGWCTEDYTCRPIDPATGLTLQGSCAGDSWVPRLPVGQKCAEPQQGPSNVVAQATASQVRHQFFLVVYLVVSLHLVIS